MHKDKPPGLFAFPDRSPQHAVWVGLATGFVLSILVHATLVIARAEPTGSRPPLKTPRETPPREMPPAPSKDSAAAAAPRTTSDH